MLRLRKIGSGTFPTASPYTSMGFASTTPSRRVGTGHRWRASRTTLRIKAVKVHMLMHQGIGLDRFNALPRGRAVHALFECCCSLAWSGHLADGRPYRSYADLLTRADSELFALSDADLDHALDCHPGVARRVHTTASSLEQCAVWAPDEATMAAVVAASGRYESRFGYPYLWCAAGRDATALLDDLTVRLSNSPEAERKTMAGELAKINRIRIERMLGPEGGYGY